MIDLEKAADVMASLLTAAGGTVIKRGTLELDADGRTMIRNWTIDCGDRCIGLDHIIDAARAALREQGWIEPARSNDLEGVWRNTNPPEPLRGEIALPPIVYTGDKS